MPTAAQTCIHTDLQTHRLTDTHAYRRTDLHTHRPTDTQTNRYTCLQTHRPTDTQTYIHTDKQIHRLTDTHAYRLTDIHVLVNTYRHIPFHRCCRHTHPGCYTAGPGECTHPSCCTRTGPSYTCLHEESENTRQMNVYETYEIFFVII